MAWLVTNISRLMTVSGVLTLTMIYALFAPEAALQSSFGESLSGPVASIVVRNWGALIALVGGMLIYGAGKPAVRPLVLTVAASSKIVFIALVLSQGGRFLSQQVGVAVVLDAIWVVVFALYLLAARRDNPLNANF
jgi:hypothetical protein